MYRPFSSVGGSKMVLDGLVNRYESILGEVGEPTSERKKREKDKIPFSYNFLGARLNSLAVYVGKVSLAAANLLFSEISPLPPTAAVTTLSGADPPCPCSPRAFTVRMYGFPAGGLKMGISRFGPSK